MLFSTQAYPMVPLTNRSNLTWRSFRGKCEDSHQLSHQSEFEILSSPPRDRKMMELISPGRDGRADEDEGEGVEEVPGQVRPQASLPGLYRRVQGQEW